MYVFSEAVCPDSVSLSVMVLTNSRVLEYKRTLCNVELQYCNVEAESILMFKR